MTETLTIQKSSEVNKTPKHGYWSSHVKHQLSVKENITQFCGWGPLRELISIIPEEAQDFYIALFKTGSRVTEALLLKKRNFTVDREAGTILVNEARLLKKYVKIGKYKDSEGHDRWTTKGEVRFRKDFYIMLREPLSDRLCTYLETVKDSDGYLFPSPYRHSKKYKKLHPEKPDELKTREPDVNKKRHRSASWAYRLIRKVNDKLPEYYAQYLKNHHRDPGQAEALAMNLKRRLGLLKKWYDENGDLISNELHIWLHWFRSMRASELRQDYRFDSLELRDWFSWETTATAEKYCRQGGSALVAKMSMARPNFQT